MYREHELVHSILDSVGHLTPSQVLQHDQWYRDELGRFASPGSSSGLSMRQKMKANRAINRRTGEIDRTRLGVTNAEMNNNRNLRTAVNELNKAAQNLHQAQREASRITGRNVAYAVIGGPIGAGIAAATGPRARALNQAQRDYHIAYRIMLEAR